MKRSLALLALVGVALTGCSSNDDEQRTGPASTQAALASTPSVTLTVPDVAGMTVKEAGRVLESSGLKWKLVPMIPEELKELKLEETESATNEFVVDSQNKSLGYVPEQDVILVYASPTEELIGSVNPWRITCTDDSYDEDSIEDVHVDLASVWKNKNFEDYATCSTEFIGTNFEPTKQQQKVIDIANVHWDGDEQPHAAFETAMDVCTVPGAGSIGGSDSWGDVPDAWLKAGAALCPEAPFHKEMNKWATGQIITEGNHVVGEDIKAGTYRSGKKTSDCYWARLTPGGDIIANDFVSYAAAGVTVTVRKGEVFEIDDSCGAWEKQ